MPNLHETLDFATRMHAGVNDWTGLPYITHPVWVMMHLPANRTEDDRHIALMHDVFEDCHDRLFAEYDMKPVIDEEFGVTNIEDLIEKVMTAKGYSDYVHEGLRLLTRDVWNLSYKKYVKNIVSSGHTGAMWVKYTDNKHNTDADRRLLLSGENLERSIQMQPRYEKSMALLRKGLGLEELG